MQYKGSSLGIGVIQAERDTVIESGGTYSVLRESAARFAAVRS